jgi:hypothetical protein
MDITNNGAIPEIYIFTWVSGMGCSSIVFSNTQNKTSKQSYNT